ncbi:MAG: putative rane protein, partial [Gammaproteobacteria bacterium]|nr:putative rane protein [Gammaproteobacteria bacterium]
MAQPAQTLTPTTRMAIQAAIAVTLAILFGHYFQFERAYWAILTTMVLVCQTWGESVRKSITRIGMTIVGGITGTLIYFWVKDYHLLFICLLGCIFFAVFFLETSYLWVVFFLTNLVVFLFALLQSWNVKLLAARIEETFIGAVIAIATTALILPTRAKTQLATDLPNFVKLAAELT